jgi:hypothetical protein
MRGHKDLGRDIPCAGGIPVGPVNLLGVSVIAQVRLNRSEDQRRRASSLAPVTDPALLARLHAMPSGESAYDPVLWAETSELPGGIVDRGDDGGTVIRLLEQPLVIADVILPGDCGRELRAVQHASLFAGFTRRWVRATRATIPDSAVLEAKLCGVGLLGPHGQVVLPAEPPTSTAADVWTWLLAEKAYRRWLKQNNHRTLRCAERTCYRADRACKLSDLPEHVGRSRETSPVRWWVRTGLPRRLRPCKRRSHWSS